MTKTKMNYENNVIYKICCKDTNIKDIYVGHTTCFTKRKFAHKSTCTNSKTKNYHCIVYECIRNNGGWDNWDMIELEKFPCKDGNEARAKERNYIELMSATLNKAVPNRTSKEWCQENKDRVREYHKEYIEDNKEKIKEYMKGYMKEYLKTNKDKLFQCYKKIYNTKMKTERREHYELNKENINEKCKAYYMLNKNKILEQHKKYKQTKLKL